MCKINMAKIQMLHNILQYSQEHTPTLDVIIFKKQKNNVSAR